MTIASNPSLALGVDDVILRHSVNRTGFKTQLHVDISLIALYESLKFQANMSPVHHTSTTSDDEKTSETSKHRILLVLWFESVGDNSI